MMRNACEPIARQLQDSADWHAALDNATIPAANLSMAQLLDSRPGSAAQIWHADNFDGGYTVVVAVGEVTAENGAANKARPRPQGVPAPVSMGPGPVSMGPAPAPTRDHGLPRCAGRAAFVNSPT